MVHHFTPDSVMIESPGSSIAHTRAEVEGWLVGMNAARRMASDEACRQEVAITIKANRRRRGNETLTKTESAQSFKSAVKLEPPHVGCYATLIAAFCALCVLCGFNSNASEIIRGYAPQDGQQLYAADLDNLIDESVIGVQFYNDQQTTPVLGGGYYFLVLNPANQTFYRLNAQQVLYGNTNIFLNAPPEAVPAYGLLLFCDPTNGWVASTTVSNFLWNSASNINVAGLSFANTNNAGAAMQFVLPPWPYPGAPSGESGGSPYQFGPTALNTNYPAHFLIFDTNGIPYREGLSNLELNIASDQGRVFALPWEYAQEFYPWRLLGTNSVFPDTNAFGWTTNFPIVAYFQTNNGDTMTNATLTDTDTIPINAWQEGVVGVGPTNTSATLLSVYEYMTNKNALPPYTIARAQFSGYHVSWSMTNMSASTGIITNLSAAILWSNPSPVSIQFTSGNPYTPNLYSNTLYWAQVTNQPVLSFQLFTNLANAQLRVNPVLGLSGYIANFENLLWVTNYTSVNCAVVPTCNGTSVNSGIWECFFLTPSQTPLYYVTGTAQNTGGGPYGWVALPYDYSWALPTTNGFAIGEHQSGSGWQEVPLVEVLAQPQ